MLKPSNLWTNELNRKSQTRKWTMMEYFRWKIILVSMFRSIKFCACGFRFWGDFYPRRTLPVSNWDMNCVRNHVNRFEVGWVFLPISQANVYSMSDILEMWISDIFIWTSCPKIETNCSTTSYPFESLLTNWIAFFSLEQSTTIITLNAKEFTFQPFQLILLYVLTCDGILLKA